VADIVATDDKANGDRPLPESGGAGAAGSRAAGGLSGLIRAVALPRWIRRMGQRALRGFGHLLPTGLYARALLIIITPIVLLESVVAFAFMERHWQAVTRRLSEATARDIAALIDVYEDYQHDDEYARLQDLARDRLGLTLRVLPAGDLPVAQPKPFFSLLDRTLSREIAKQVGRPFWIDTIGQSDHVEIRVKHDNAVLGFLARRNQTYASNSHIFLMWMVSTSVVLLIIAVLFLRNQIRPILRLAAAADAFGKGRPVPPDFRPRGAREVRQASQSFLEMRDRITQHVDQRTTMLAGVSHDLRTVLTRLRLQLAFLGEGSEVEAMKGDIKEMQHMLEDYLAFAKGDGGELATPTHVASLLEEVVSEGRHLGVPITLSIHRRRRDLRVPLKRNAMKRAITNLVTNAARFGERVELRVTTDRSWLHIAVDDDGPGIPEAERENVFRPFYRLDHARNQDEGNSGLGLAIARDIAKSHGGDITLGRSAWGGLSAVVRVPL
jgi:two-component system osmolarity sensor histidine kinase EnvZ